MEGRSNLQGPAQKVWLPGKSRVYMMCRTMSPGSSLFSSPLPGIYEWENICIQNCMWEKCVTSSNVSTRRSLSALLVLAKGCGDVVEHEGDICHVDMSKRNHTNKSWWFKQKEEKATACSPLLGIRGGQGRAGRAGTACSTRTITFGERWIIFPCKCCKHSGGSRRK